MHSPLAALTWEIWRRGRRSASLSLACVSFCALINLGLLDRLHIPSALQNVFPTVFGLLMTLSFLFLMGAFNYTEINATREWNGFPYRLFTLPVSTWQLVALPLVLGVLAVESLFLAWIKLVWTHESIPMPAWFGLVFGTYMVFYQTALWTLAGFRVTRVAALALGGVSGVAVASLPFLAKVLPLPWLTDSRLIESLLVLTLIAFIVAWATVARQRRGGGQRSAWIKALFYCVIDALPRRTKDFASPGAAQFWFEWRRTGWLLPTCTALVLAAIIAPSSWFNRHDPRYANYVLGRLSLVPLVLALAIGKGFVKCEFWTTNLSMPTFMAVRPLRAGDFVVGKMKVAALSVAMAWLLVLLFVGLWLPLWADQTTLKPLFFGFRTLYPHSWLAILVLSYLGCMVLTWRCLVSGLWAGLSGKPLHYFGPIAAQVLLPILLLVAVGIWSDTIDRTIKNNPNLVKFPLLRTLSWSLAFLVIAKSWFAVFSWNRITLQRARQYLLIWSSATLCFLALAIMARPLLDVYRQGYLYLLGALLLFPFARLGIAPLSLAMNRHRG